MIKTFDAHNDCVVEICDENKLKNYYENLKIKNIKIISAIWTTEFEKPILNNVLNKYMQIKKFSNNFCFSIEDMGNFETNEIKKVLTSKPAYVSLTWNYNNKFAGGALENLGLTFSGQKLVKELEKNNVILDVAHLNKKSFYDAVNIIQKPIICSHTAISEICQHPRNLDKYQIKEIILSGGIVGLCFVSNFLNSFNKATISDITKHIMYFLEHFDDKKLCLGTDFNGTKNLPIGVNDYDDLIKIKQELKKLGVKESALENIFYNNLTNFINSNKNQF